jgi:hypothetical protein
MAYPPLRPSWAREGDAIDWRRRRTTVEAKQTVRALLDRLPDDCSVGDVLYHLYVLQAVERYRLL